VTGATLNWWMMLCVVASINVLAWAASAAVARRRQSALAPATWSSMRLQVLLSAGYVVGCAYRCAFPVFDVQRLCLVDSWMSSVIVGRTVATIAELCFAAQWAVLLSDVAASTRSPLATMVCRLVVPLIAVAEVCSWYAVLTTSNVGHVLEESIWGMCAALLVASFALAWPRSRREVRPMLAAACVIGLAYVVYMFEVDVPMYWTRWVLDVRHGHRFLSIAEGVADASGRWIVSHRWADWRTEVVWMSLYFSVAVWLSIGLIHVPGFVGSHASNTPTPRNPRRAIDLAPLRNKTAQS
jgi:hypothetical protein